jgi:hypothetical protein
MNIIHIDLAFKGGIRPSSRAKTRFQSGGATGPEWKRRQVGNQKPTDMDGLACSVIEMKHELTQEGSEAGG